MLEQIIFRKQVLRAVEAFLQATPTSIAQGQQIIEQCYSALWDDSQNFTLDGLIWRSLIHPLTDSIFFESQEYLQEIRQLLLGFPSKEREKLFITQNFQPYLTADEAEWYAQLLSILNFVQSIPFAQIAAATAEARQRKIPGNLILQTIPEAMPILQAEEEYQRRKTVIETLAARIPSPPQFGQQTIYQLALREVSDLLTAIDIRLSAVYFGYPRPLPPYAEQGDGMEGSDADMSELLAWAGRVLGALGGTGTLFLSWRLASAPSFEADLLLVSLH